MAKFQCQYPKQIIGISLYHYDKRSGESMGLNSCLSKLISVKAQVTKAERMMKNYIEQNRQNNMFFDEYTDEELVKFREKLERKKIECAECEKRLEQFVEKGGKKMANIVKLTGCKEVSHDIYAYFTCDAEKH